MKSYKKQYEEQTFKSATAIIKIDDLESEAHTSEYVDWLEQTIAAKDMIIKAKTRSKRRNK